MDNTNTRQVARTVYVPPDLVSYLNWATLGEQRADLGCALDVRQHTDGGITVTFFWEVTV
jgi:hypothetical protein